MTKKKAHLNKGKGQGKERSSTAKGKATTSEAGGKGAKVTGAIAESLSDPVTNVPETLRLIKSALHHGWDVPLEARKEIPKKLFMMFCGAPKVRQRMVAANLLRMMLKDNIDAISVIDKIQRLDMGLATDNVDHNLTGDVRIEMRSAEGDERMAALLMELAELQAGIEPADVGGNGHKKNGQNGSGSNGHGE